MSESSWTFHPSVVLPSVCTKLRVFDQPLRSIEDSTSASGADWSYCMLFLANKFTDLEEKYQRHVNCLVSKPQVTQLCD